MGSIRAVVVAPDAPGQLELSQVGRPTPEPAEALVRVSAISLNRGEVRWAQSAPPGVQIGWDLAGVIAQAAADGSGPPVGSPVVGVVRRGAWAELVAVPTDSLTRLPSPEIYDQAATLPIAGLTALHALAQGGSLIGQPVLITGASGGVGLFAIQLGLEAGGQIVAHVRNQARVGPVREAGATTVVVGEDIRHAAEHGPYHLIIDGVGGPSLAHALTLLAPGGTLVSYGRTAGPSAEIDIGQFFDRGGLRLYGLTIFHELQREPARIGLARLVQLLREGRLQPYIAITTSWRDIGDVARSLLDRSFAGKAVLLVD